MTPVGSLVSGWAHRRPRDAEGASATPGLRRFVQTCGEPTPALWVGFSRGEAGVNEALRFIDGGVASDVGDVTDACATDIRLRKSVPEQLRAFGHRFGKAEIAGT